MNAQSQSLSWTQRLTLGLLTLSLAPLVLPLAATAAPKYRPPKRPAAQRTESTATRSGDQRIGSLQGCAKDLAVPLTLLMPESLSYTSSQRPPLYLYLAKPKKLVVKFYENQASRRQLLWRQSVEVGTEGIVQMTYPSNDPALEPGKTYTWQVSIDCGTKDVNNSLVSTTESTIVYSQPSRWFQSQLDAAKTPQRRAELYAVSGFWTDTLAATAAALAEDASAEQDLLSLLRQVGLDTVADRERAQSAVPTKTMARSCRGATTTDAAKEG